jgi:hypothetical protein
MDDSGRMPATANSRRELFEAMKMIARDGIGPRDQAPSMGCSIKWKES